jgi:hypothetical protein
MFAAARNTGAGEPNIFTLRRLQTNPWRANMKSILDHKFHYTNSVQTDLKKTFARVRRELCRLEKVETTISEEDSKKILQIAARRAALRAGANTL